MEIRSVQPGDREEWGAHVRACAGHALHYPELHLADVDASVVRQFLVHDGGTPKAVALALDLEPGLVGRLRGRRSLRVFPTAPASSDPEAASEVRVALVEEAVAAGMARVSFQPSWGARVDDADPLAPYRTGSITEFVLDLTGGHDAVLAGMHKVHRKNIRRAGRAGIEIVEDSTPEGLLRLRRMQLASSERADERTEGFAVRDEEYFRRVAGHVYGAGLGHVLFARVSGEPVAALAWIQAAGRAQTVRSGSMPRGYEARAMYLLHDELVRRCIAGSVVELNIGGVPSGAAVADHPQSGLYEFKQGFGGQPMERHVLDIVAGEYRA